MNKQNDYQSVKISIIVPFYNVENYVAQCLDSILSQDMLNFEIIAVNDGSTDTTPCLLEEYAKKDCRIKLVHLENGGLSWARNQGILRATGEYIMFIDGDDFILPGCLFQLYDCAHLNNADVVVFNYMTWKDGVFGEPFQFSYPQNMIIDSLTAVKYMFLNYDYSVCFKFIKRKMYIEQNICFEEGRLAEDVPISYQLLSSSQRIVYLDKAFYVYVHRSNSITHVPETFKRVSDTIHGFDLIKEEIQKACLENELIDVFNYAYLTYLIETLKECYIDRRQHASLNELKEIEKLLRKCLSKISSTSMFSNPYVKQKKISHKIKYFRIKIGLYKLEKLIMNSFISSFIKKRRKFRGSS